MQRESFTKRRRYLSLVLPRWPTDRFRRLAPSLERAAPLALYEKTTGGLRLAAVDANAARLGLKRGQALTDARALAPGLVAEKVDRLTDERAFLKLADWHTRYSPLVAAHGPAEIVIDITGCAHLFGGEEAMLDEALARLEGFGVEAHGAVADTAGAGLACAYCRARRVIAPGAQEETLADLPVAALRLETEIAGGLNRLGLKRIGRLYDMPRAALAARFGKRLNERLDQALGRAPEPLTFLRPPPDTSAARRLAEPIATEESILLCLAPLAEALQEKLERDARGGRRFELTLYRVDNALARLEVRTSAPMREAAHITRLIKNRLEDIRSDFDAGFGFELMRLSAHDCERFDAAQGQAFVNDGVQETDAALIDRLSNRLGAANVARITPRNTHLPERAVSFTPALSNETAPPAPAHDLKRPLKLLARPEAITVMAQIPDGPPVRFHWRRVSYRVAKASGPERIEDDWRREPPRPARDYYRIETTEGWRFWIFRAGVYDGAAAPKWYLHGFFP